MNHHVNDEAATKQNALGMMQACACGGIHLSFGAVTLHFAHDEVALLGELILAVATANQHLEAPTTSRCRHRRKKRRLPPILH